jgi:hypothetical protein
LVDVDPARIARCPDKLPIDTNSAMWVRARQGVGTQRGLAKEGQGIRSRIPEPFGQHLDRRFHNGGAPGRVSLIGCWRGNRHAD